MEWLFVGIISAEVGVFGVHKGYQRAGRLNQMQYLSQGPTYTRPLYYYHKMRNSAYRKCAVTIAALVVQADGGVRVQTVPSLNTSEPTHWTEKQRIQSWVCKSTIKKTKR